MMEQISRKIVISQSISDRLAGDVVEQIMAINDYDSYMVNNLAKYQIQPIEMFINSGGGSATAGFAIITAMEMSEAPIITYGMGMVASMALGIFIAGDFRIATRLCRFMYHSVAYGQDGHIKDHEDSLREANITQAMYNSFFLNKSKMKAEHMSKILLEKKNFFFSGKKAVRLGIADELQAMPESKIEVVTAEETVEIFKELEEKNK